MNLKKVLVWCVVNWLLLAKTQVAPPLPTAKGTVSTQFNPEKTADTLVKLEFMTHKSKAHAINHQL